MADINEIRRRALEARPRAQASEEALAKAQSGLVEKVEEMRRAVMGAGKTEWERLEEMAGIINPSRAGADLTQSLIAQDAARRHKADAREDDRDEMMERQVDILGMIAARLDEIDATAKKNAHKAQEADKDQYDRQGEILSFTRIAVILAGGSILIMVALALP